MIELTTLYKYIIITSCLGNCSDFVMFFGILSGCKTLCMSSLLGVCHSVITLPRSISRCEQFLSSSIFFKIHLFFPFRWARLYLMSPVHVIMKQAYAVGPWQCFDMSLFLLFHITTSYYILYWTITYLSWFLPVSVGVVVMIKDCKLNACLHSYVAEMLPFRPIF